MDLELPTFGLASLDFPEGHITSLRLSSLSLKGRSLLPTGDTDMRLRPNDRRVDLRGGAP